MLKNKEVYPESSRWRKQALSFLVLSFLVSVCTIFMINAVRSAVNTTRFLDREVPGVGMSSAFGGAGP